MVVRFYCGDIFVNGFNDVSIFMIKDDGECVFRVFVGKCVGV